MKKITRTLLIATIILFTQTTAQAIIFLYRTGFYVAGSGSIDWNLTNDVSLDVNTAIPTLKTGSVLPDTGFNANLAVGYYMDQWRIEAEGNYRNKQDTPFSNGDVTVTNFGYVSQFSVMANAYYDIPLCDEWWGFYLGLGAGCAFSEIQLTGAINASENQSRFAAQAIAGTFYNINECIALTFAYRFFVTTSPEDVFFTNGVTNATMSAESSPITQSLELGIRISL